MLQALWDVQDPNRFSGQEDVALVKPRTCSVIGAGNHMKFPGSAGEVSDAGDVLQALWEASGGVRDHSRVPGQEDLALVKASFFVHVAERVVCEPCGNKVTHTKDFYEQVICASATSIRRCQQVRS